jgi:hypothetical protein
MKFIKEDGTIEDGTPITDDQIRLRDTFVEYLHETMCRGAYHSTYSPGRCVEEGHKLAMMLDAFNGEGRLCDVLFNALPKPEPEVEEATPIPAPVAVEKPADDMPF